MNKFIQQYFLDIFDTQENYDPSLLGVESTNNGYCQLSPLILQNLYLEAIDENKFSELAPVPKPLLNVICSKVKTKISNSLTLTYKEIYQLLQTYNYIDLYDFKLALQYLKTFESGFLIIGICNHNLNEFKQVFNNQYITDEYIHRFFNLCKQTDGGDTYSGDPILKAKFKFACIWLNRELMIPNSTWKDTLSHELTHFIHRIVVIQRTTYTR